jgi:hypothetical protein
MEQLPTLQYLLDTNIPLLQTDTSKNTPLHHCIHQKATNEFSLLLTHILSKFDKSEQELFMNYKNKDGNTVLHEAILQEHQPMVKALWDRSIIDANIKNNDGLTCRQLEERMVKVRSRESQEKESVRLREEVRRNARSKSRYEEKVVVKARNKRKLEVSEEQEFYARKIKFRILFFVALFLALVGLYFVVDYYAASAALQKNQDDVFH